MLSPLLTPFGEERRIQPLPAQQGTNFTGERTGFGLLQDTFFVFRTEAAVFGFGSYFRIRLDHGRAAVPVFIYLFALRQAVLPRPLHYIQRESCLNLY